jgi:hypothetical protein
MKGQKHNRKRAYPKNGIEHDTCSRAARRVCAYLHLPGMKRFAKRCINRRFRQINKEITIFEHLASRI